jgi:hypothetical protein
MSTVWEGEIFRPAGQSDVEQMTQIQHFNTPMHDSLETLKASISDLEVLDQPSKEEDENAIANHRATEEDPNDPATGGLQAPPDGGLTAWLQGKLPQK